MLQEVEHFLSLVTEGFKRPSDELGPFFSLMEDVGTLSEEVKTSCEAIYNARPDEISPVYSKMIGSTFNPGERAALESRVNLAEADLHIDGMIGSRLRELFRKYDFPEVPTL